MDPKYKQIAEAMKQKILSHIYEEKLPTEDQLMVEFQASRNTIRNAVQVLVEQAYLYRVHGSGIYIRPTPENDIFNMNKLRSTKDYFLNRQVKNKVLSLEVIQANEQQAELFKTEKGALLYAVQRLRYIDGLPYFIEKSLYNKQIVPYLGQDILEKSIYEYMEQDLKLTLGFADRYFQVDRLTKEQAALLDLKPGDPALLIHEQAYLNNGILFNSSEICHHYKYSHFFATARND